MPVNLQDERKTNVVSLYVATLAVPLPGLHRLPAGVPLNEIQYFSIPPVFCYSNTKPEIVKGM